MRAVVFGLAVGAALAFFFTGAVFTELIPWSVNGRVAFAEEK
jgi:hypothetical protein